MWALLRLIVGLIIDLFRSRAELEAEVLVLKQQIIVLQRGRPIGCHFWLSTGSFWAGLATCFRRPATRSPSFDRIPWFGGIVQVSDCFGAGSPGVV
jgi:hypothetical protein